MDRSNVKNEGTKEMNNEPVAWISRLPKGNVYNCAWAEKQNDDDIPLYTHPVKELTDEKIEEVFDREVGLNSACGWEKDFARAILRKAKKK